MRLGLSRFSWIASLALAWGLTWTGRGWTQEKNLPAPVRREAKVSAEEQANHLVEIQVELAWLGDPITFPYFLEAHVAGGKLEVRGYVPGKTVQEHAVRLAKLNCALPVQDQTREHSSLAVRSASLAPEKLQTSVKSALNHALPHSARGLHVSCDVDGKVTVEGPVKTFDEKLAVSQSLRRLHGCAYVVNMTRVEAIAGEAPARLRGDAVASLPAPLDARADVPPGARRDEIQPVQAKDAPKSATFPGDPLAPSKKDGPFGGFFQRLFGKKTDSAPPKDTGARFPGSGRDPVKITTVGDPKKIGDAPMALPKGPPGTGVPYEAPGVVVMPVDKTPPKGGKMATPSQVKARLERLYPQYRPVVTALGGNQIKVEITTRTEKEGSEALERILNLPELSGYSPQLQLTIDAPKDGGR